MKYIVYKLDNGSKMEFRQFVIVDENNIFIWGETLFPLVIDILSKNDINSSWKCDMGVVSSSYKKLFGGTEKTLKSVILKKYPELII